MNERYLAVRQKVSPEKRSLLLSLEVPEEDIGLPSGDIIGFGHTFKAPQGILQGEPLRLNPVQVAFLRDVYNRVNPETGRRVVKQGYFSIARRNGKGLLAGVIVLAHLVGPARKPNSLIMSAANDKDQAGVVYQFVLDLARTNRFIWPMLKPVESTKRLINPGMNALYRCVSAEAKTKLGFGPDLIVYDEMGAAPKRELYDALSTSLGSQSEPLLLGISTQAPSDTHFFSQLLDYGVSCMKGEVDDPTVIAHVHATPIGADLMDEDAWKLSNPGLGEYRDTQDLRSAITRGLRMPSLMGSIRNLLLNQRVSAQAGLFTPEIWDGCAGEVAEEAFLEGEVYAGLDLSARLDLTSLALVAKWKDRVYIRVDNFAPEDGLDERENRDRAPYSEWVDMGRITLTPGKSVGYEFVGMRMIYLWEKYAVNAFFYDRWRMDILKKELADMGADPPLEPFGQGFKDMSPAIDELETRVVQKEIRHGGDPVLRWAIGNVKIDTDAAGNRKPSKKISYGRIDPAVAVLMALGGMCKQEDESFDAEALIG